MIEYVSIVGTEGVNEREALRGYCECEVPDCGSMAEEYVRVDGVLHCVKCAVKKWKSERGERILGEG